MKSWLIGKDLDAGKDWGQEKKGTTEDEMVGWHQWLHGHEFEQAPGVGDAIQPSHPLSSPSVFSLSQHQGLFKWLSGQSIGASPSASILPMNIQGWFPLGFTGLISLLSNGLSRTFSSIAFRKHRFFGTQVFMVQHWHLYMTTVKTIALTRWTFVGKVMSLFLICCLGWS